MVVLLLVFMLMFVSMLDDTGRSGEEPDDSLGLLHHALWMTAGTILDKTGKIIHTTYRPPKNDSILYVTAQLLLQVNDLQHKQSIPDIFFISLKKFDFNKPI